MPKRIPIKVAEKVCKENKCRQIGIVAWDGDRVHIVTYGITKKDCEQAGLLGKKLAEFLHLIKTEKGEPNVITQPQEINR